MSRVFLFSFLLGRNRGREEGDYRPPIGPLVDLLLDLLLDPYLHGKSPSLLTKYQKNAQKKKTELDRELRTSS